MHYNQAVPIADNIKATLSPHCTLIHIAGSIRRQKEDIGDIEIVCRPKAFVQQDLFGDVQTEQRSVRFIEAVTALGTLTTGSPSAGRQCKVLLPEGIKLDMYIPAAEDYYRQLAIRTGSADYARHVIAFGWRRLGWCGVKDVGLRLIKECYRQNAQWHCSLKNPHLPPAWQSEEEFFTWLQVPFVPPQQRWLTKQQVSDINNNYYESNHLK